MSDSFLGNYIRLFKYYKQLAEKAIEQLPEESAYFWAPGDKSNSIAIIMQHIAGNMKSRWTDFLTTDGEKEWRNRDEEFELQVESISELIQEWDEAWLVLFEALESITEADKDQLVYIRNKGHRINEAVERQLAHYAYHIGQIVFLSRMVAADSWQSVSIPKGQSVAYNKKAFGDGQREEHFTKEFLK